MQFTQRQRLLRKGARPLAAALLLGLLLGFLGPFGSYPAYSTATRYAFWMGLTATGVVAAVAADAVLPISMVRAGAIRIGALALISALPMTFVVAWTLSLLQPGRIFAPKPIARAFGGGGGRSIADRLRHDHYCARGRSGRGTHSCAGFRRRTAKRAAGDFSVRPPGQVAAGDWPRHPRARNGGSLSSCPYGRRERVDPDAHGRCGRRARPATGRAGSPPLVGRRSRGREDTGGRAPTVASPQRRFPRPGRQDLRCCSEGKVLQGPS